MSQSQYASATDMQLIGITPAALQRFGSAATVAQLQAASSIADSYLASQFTLPLIVSPQGWDMSLTLRVCNIAAYLLYCQYGFSPSTSQADQLIQKRYDDALEWLGQIRDEKIFPQWADSSTTVPEAGPYIVSNPQIGFTPQLVGGATWPWGWPE